MASVAAGRPNFGPNSLARTEHGLAAMDNLGISIDEMLIASEILQAFVRGLTTRELAEQQALRRGGPTADEWSRMVAHTWESVLSSGKYPTSGAWLVMPIFPTSRTIKKWSLPGRSNGYSTVSFPSRYRRPQGRAPPPRPDRIPGRPSHAARCQQRRRSDPAWGAKVSGTSDWAAC